MAEWDRTVDLLVMGSGAAGMGSAVRAHDLGLDVLLVEKSDQYGGNTAMSGGVCWVANNPGMAKEGIADSGYRLIFNCNEHGGQEIFHLHLHLVGGHPLGPMLGHKRGPKA